jgi:hypothetical protein
VFDANRLVKPKRRLDPVRNVLLRKAFAYRESLSCPRTCGPVSNLERPEQFNEVVREFCPAHSPRPI